ncbi:General transcription factor IIH subunit 4 [Porphyridium purpureum]|uniref:General transcription factor IIH subunit 4 n=1 Tax=Porphyridium purpureum TaxID=35688 RepID=A0A5J4YU96_PORPP|nr:General transcription factor IIH subunit 4 [Porphyridium purpureum]|eukprot:POR9402..scf229_5
MNEVVRGGVRPHKYAENMFQELEQWSRSDMQRAFRSEHAAHAVLRCVPNLARLVVMRMLLGSSRTCSASELSAWFAQDGHRSDYAKSRSGGQTPIATGHSHTRVVEPLLRLHVVRLVESAVPPFYELDPAFADRMDQILTANVRPPFDSEHESNSVVLDSPALVQRLEVFAKRRWERVLHFLVGSDSESASVSGPSDELVNALLKTRLLENCEEGLRITHVGFQFLLKDTYAQIWSLLACMLEHLFPAGSQHRVDAMGLLFQIALAVPGKPYKLSCLDANQSRFLKCCDELGLVQVGEKEQAFCVTRMGVNLVNSKQEDVASHSGGHLSVDMGELQLIVETNFRVYAYTSSSFQIALLSLFLDMRYRLPNLVVGHITKSSVRAAMSNGITAEQLVRFLNAHLHPMVEKACIPPCVSDELYLWEAEQDRVRTDDAVMIDGFESTLSFDALTTHANEIDALLWSNPRRLMLVVKAEKAEGVKQYIREQALR